MKLAPRPILIILIGLMALMSNAAPQLHVGHATVSAQTPLEDNVIYLPLVVRNYCADAYTDDFSDPNSGWPVADVSAFELGYQEGEYEIELRLGNFMAGAPAPIGGLTQYSVEADVHRQAGSTSQYALVFDLVDLNHFYMFIVDPGSRYYAVARRDSSNWFVVVPWAVSPYINSTNATNHLTVERYGAQITVSINDHLLTVATDNAYTSAGGLMVGLYAQTGDDVPAAVRFDNFRVCGAVASNLGEEVTARPSNETWEAGNPLVVNVQHDATPAR